MQFDENIQHFCFQLKIDGSMIDMTNKQEIEIKAKIEQWVG